MKKIILGAVLACLASGSVMADGWFPFNHYYDTIQNTVKLNCKWVGDFDWDTYTTPTFSIKILGDDDTVDMRLVDNNTGSVSTFLFSSDSFGMNEAGEDRYYKANKDDNSYTIHISPSNDTVGLKKEWSDTILTFNCS